MGKHIGPDSQNTGVPESAPVIAVVLPPLYTGEPGVPSTIGGEDPPRTITSETLHPLS